MPTRIRMLCTGMTSGLSTGTPALPLEAPSSRPSLPAAFLLWTPPLPCSSTPPTATLSTSSNSSPPSRSLLLTLLLNLPILPPNHPSHTTPATPPMAINIGKYHKAL